MSKDKLNQARKLIKERKYRDARKLLQTIDSPQAEVLLDQIDEMELMASAARARSGDGGGGRDVLHVLLIGLIFTALFSGTAYLLASGIGIVMPAPVVNPAPVTNAGSAAGETPAPQPVALEPTAMPTATDIPCEAQAWWEGQRARFGQIVTDATGLTINTPPSEVTRIADSIPAWRTEFEAASGPDCVAPVRSAMLAAAPALEALVAAFRTVTTEGDRVRLLIQAADSLLPVIDNLKALSVDTSADTWPAEWESFTRAECPAYRWYLDTLIARDFQRFFVTLSGMDLQSIPLTDLQNTLLELRRLRDQFQRELPDYPACVQTAGGHYVAAMDGFINGVNTLLNGDPAGAQSQVGIAQQEINAFFNELDQLDPRLR